MLLGLASPDGRGGSPVPCPEWMASSCFLPSHCSVTRDREREAAHASKAFRASLYVTSRPNKNFIAMVLEAGQEEEIADINKLFPPLSMESTRLQQHVCRLYNVHSRQQASKIHNPRILYSILIILHFLFSCCVCVVCFREL